MTNRDLFSVGMVVISVVLLTMILVAGWLQSVSARGTTAAVESVLTTRTESAADWVEDYVDATETTTHGLALWVDAGDRSLDEVKAQLVVTASIDEHLTSTGIGFVDGSWVGIRRTTEDEWGSWVVSTVTSAEDGLAQTIEVYGDALDLLASSEGDQTVRADEFPFWSDAATSAGLVWVTAPPGTGLVNAGVWASESVRDDQGELVGVVATEFPIDAMTGVLEAALLGDRGGAFLLDSDRRVIASPIDVEDIGQVSVGTSPTPTFESVSGQTLESLGVATTEVAVPGDDDVVIGFDGVMHTAEVGLESRGVAWVLHIRAMDGQIASSIFELRNALMWASGILMVVILTAAGLFFYFWRPARDLHRRANMDMLTGLLRRPRFLELAPQVLAEARRLGHTSCVVVLDLDNFKVLNDSMGHGAGDAALQRVGHALRSGTRSSDLVSRWGGDEFVVLVELLDAEDALFAVERLREHIEERLREEFPAHPDLGVTAGAAVQSGEEVDIEMLVRAADESLVQGKRTRKSRSYLAAL